MPRLRCSEGAARGKFEISPWREFGEMKNTPVFSLIFQPKTSKNFCFWFCVYYFPLIISEGRKMVVEGLEGVEREVWRVLLHKMRNQLVASLSFDLDRTTLLQAFSPH
jgi:hypothetical protein